MFITPAYAQTAAAASPMESLQSFAIPLVLIFVVFYFLMIRPQQKKMKEHRDMIASLRRGHKVVTTGGIIGTIHKVVSDSELLVEIAEGVKVRMARSHVAEVLAKPEPTGKAEEDSDGGKG